ncbi:hypothetical protein HK405_015336 [Cladochytrium tenue]|nr:hypothetical protein HK405_015336 [Cladochytrium tenue]
MTPSGLPTCRRLVVFGPPRRAPAAATTAVAAALPPTAAAPLLLLLSPPQLRLFSTSSPTRDGHSRATATGVRLHPILESALAAASSQPNTAAPAAEASAPNPLTPAEIDRLARLARLRIPADGPARDSLARDVEALRAMLEPVRRFRAPPGLRPLVSVVHELNAGEGARRSAAEANVPATAATASTAAGAGVAAAGMPGGEQGGAARGRDLLQFAPGSEAGFYVVPASEPPAGSAGTGTPK